MTPEKIEAFNRQGIDPELRNENHFFFEKSENNEYFAVPREFTHYGDTYELLETGGAVSKAAVVKDSEIGPRTMIKAGSFILNSSLVNYTVENSVITNAVLENPTDMFESRVIDSAISIGSHIFSSDIYGSDMGTNAKIGPGSSVQDTQIGDNFELGACSYILGDAPAAHTIRGGKCVIQDNVTIGYDTTIHAGVRLYSDVIIGSLVKIDEYSAVREKTIVEDFVKIGSCTQIGSESYILNRVVLEGGKQIPERSFIFHTKQDTDHETMTTRYMFKYITPFRHSYRAPYNKDSFTYDTSWLITDKKRPY